VALARNVRTLPIVSIKLWDPENWSELIVLQMSAMAFANGPKMFGGEEML